MFRSWRFAAIFCIAISGASVTLCMAIPDRAEYFKWRKQGSIRYSNQPYYFEPRFTPDGCSGLRLAKHEPDLCAYCVFIYSWAEEIWKSPDWPAFNDLSVGYHSCFDSDLKIALRDKGMREGFAPVGLTVAGGASASVAVDPDKMSEVQHDY